MWTCYKCDGLTCMGELSGPSLPRDKATYNIRLCGGGWGLSPHTQTHICHGQKPGSNGRKGLGARALTYGNDFRIPCVVRKGCAPRLKRKGGRESHVRMIRVYMWRVCVWCMSQRGAGIVVARKRGVINSTAHGRWARVELSGVAFFDEEPTRCKACFCPLSSVKSLRAAPERFLCAAWRLGTATAMLALVRLCLWTPRHWPIQLQLLNVFKIAFFFL